MDNKNVSDTGYVESRQQIIEQLPEDILRAIVQETEAIRKLAASVLLRNSKEFNERLELATNVPALRIELFNMIEESATAEELVTIMNLFPDLKVQAARTLLSKKPNADVLRKAQQSLIRSGLMVPVLEQINRILSSQGEQANGTEESK
jgi:hypothetical protein